MAPGPLADRPLSIRQRMFIDIEIRSRAMSVLEELAAALGEAKVRLPGAIPPRNWADAAGLPPVEPLGLVLPETTEDVATVLSICHRHAQPVVTQGGLTGLAGGAHPDGGE